MRVVILQSSLGYFLIIDRLNKFSDSGQGKTNFENNSL